MIVGDVRDRPPRPRDRPCARTGSGRSIAYLRRQAHGRRALSNRCFTNDCPTLLAMAIREDFAAAMRYAYISTMKVKPSLSMRRSAGGPSPSHPVHRIISFIRRLGVDGRRRYRATEIGRAHV